MKIIKILSIFVLICLNFSCKEKQQRLLISAENSGIFKIKVEFPGDVDKLEPLYLSEIADSVSYIQPKGMLFVPRSVSDFDDCMIIKGLETPIQLWDSVGNFMNNIGNYGRGPEEYIQPKYGANNNTKEIYVQSVGEKIFKVFNLKGRLDRRVENRIIDVRGSLYNIVPVGDNLLMTYFIQEQKKGNEIPELAIYDPKNNLVIDSLPDRHGVKYAAGLPNHMHPEFAVYSDGKTAYYMSAYGDTLYRADCKSIVPVIAFDFGKYKYSAKMIGMVGGKEYNSARTAKIRPYSMISTDSHLFLELSYTGDSSEKGYSFVCKINLSNGSHSYHPNTFVNDLDNGPNFNIPYIFDGMTSIDVATLKSDPEGYYAKQMFKRNNVTKKMKNIDEFTKLYNSSDEDSSPIIMKLVKL